MKNITVSLLIFFVLLFSGVAYPEAQAGKHTQVLVLNSYNKGYKWTDNIVRGIESVLAKERDIVMRIEYMDTKMINTPYHLELLKNLYQNKFGNTEFEVIVATDDDALLFLRKYRDALFPGTPVVFCGINSFTPAKVEGFDRYTGVNEEADFASTIEVALKLHPRTKKFYVISDSLTTGILERKALEQVIPQFTKRVEFVFVEEMTMEELKRKLSRLEPDSLVMLLSFFRDKSGTAFTPAEAVPEITGASSVPVYGSVDYLLGSGITGGMLRNSFYQGETAGRLALRIIRGERAEDIPVVMESPNAFMFDYDQLSRFGISTSKLPPRSIIINEPETFYYKYKHLIWAVSAVIVVLVVYIMVLLFNIRKRIRAQRGLHRIIEATTSIFETRSSENFFSGLQNHLTSLLDIKDNSVFIKSPGSGQDNRAENAVIIGSTGGTLAPGARAKKSLHTVGIDLVEKALTNRKTVFSKDRSKCVAYFDNMNLPSDLVYLEGRTKFDDLDGDLIDIFSSTVSMAFHNLERQRIQESLELAEQIQMSMLPRDFASFSEKFGLCTYAYLRPAKLVGGDLYDFFAVDADHVCLTVGDVSDKGVPAALFMAVTKTLVRSASEGNTRPDTILKKVNSELCCNNDQCMFVTLFIAILNHRTGEMVFSNAGHNPPYVLSGKEVIQIGDLRGIVLGASEEAEYETGSMTLKPGDGVFMYSDGVTEANDLEQQLFGSERLKASLKMHAGLSSGKLTAAVLNDLEAFTRGAAQSDDITILSAQFRVSDCVEQ